MLRPLSERLVTFAPISFALQISAPVLDWAPPILVYRNYGADPVIDNVQVKNGSFLRSEGFLAIGPRTKTSEMFEAAREMELIGKSDLGRNICH